MIAEALRLCSHIIGGDKPYDDVTELSFGKLFPLNHYCHLKVIWIDLLSKTNARDWNSVSTIETKEANEDWPIYVARSYMKTAQL